MMILVFDGCPKVIEKCVSVYFHSITQNGFVEINVCVRQNRIVRELLIVLCRRQVCSEVPTARHTELPRIIQTLSSR